MLTLRARHFSKIKGKKQYIRRNSSAQSKEKFSIIEGMIGISFSFGVGLAAIRMASLPLGGVGGGPEGDLEAVRALNIQNIIHKHHHISDCH